MNSAADQTTASTASDEVSGQAHQESTASAESTANTLVEEVSIDGMCGVY